MHSKEKITLNISEIFYSIQGESTYAGLPCIFIRFQGCNIRCQWCDTEYALDANKKVHILTVDETIEKIKKYKCNFITVTGGEPLMQSGVHELLSILCNAGYIVSLETNGNYSLENIDNRVIKIVDFKCPSSKMEKHNNFDNVKFLNKNDQVKFVIANRIDYVWAKKILIKYQLTEKAGEVLFSAVFSLLEPAKLSQWILDDSLSVRMQLQMHKYIWDPDKRGV
jgi:7-carboxy-7-deazaguanine synthase